MTHFCLPTTQAGRWFGRIVFLLGPWAAFVCVEFLNKSNLIKDFAPWQLLFNLAWYYIIFIVARLLLGRIRRAGTLAILLCFFAGLANHYILRFRGRILFPADLPAWRTAANVADSFDYAPDVHMIQALIVLTVYLFLLWSCPPERKRRSISLVPCVTLWVLVVGYCYAFFCTPMLPSLNIYTQQWNTRTNGFLFNFTVAARYSVLETPEGYSDKAVAQIVDRFPALPADPSVTQPVNLIVVMNEGFADMTIFEGLEISEDPTPFLHSMEEDTISGLLFPPVTGGGTASTEFEFLTGLSNSFLPPHCVAYQLYVPEDTPALSTVLDAEGFATTAFHPYQASGWNRPMVYQHLDFDTQLYNTDVKAPRMVRRYISDSSSYETIYQITDQAAAEGKPAFVFNVTMQNHSGYAQGWKNLQDIFTLSPELEQADPNARQYFALARESDNALRELIHHYSQVDEPTLIVFFGDHQPSLKNAFYEVLYGKTLEQRTDAEVMQQYAVPFFLWANYDIPEYQDVIVSSNLLSVLVARQAGLPMTGWMNFLSQLYDHLPVVTTSGYVTAEGFLTADAQALTPEQQAWLQDYKYLAYCALKDISTENYHFFHPTP